MKKRTLTLMLAATLGAAGAQSPADSRLSSATVTVEVGKYSGPLSSLLAAIAMSAGYELVLDGNIDAQLTAGQPQGSSARPVVVNFANKPFSEVWPLLMDVYGLSYDMVKVGGQDMIRVTGAPIQKVFKLNHAQATDAVNQVKLFFGTPQYTDVPQKDAQGNVTSVLRTLADVRLDSPTLRIVADSRTNSLIVRGTNKELADVERIAAEIDVPVTAAVPEEIGRMLYVVKGRADDMAKLLAAQYPRLLVTPVGSTGQLVITGRRGDLEAAAQLLAQVDRPVAAAAQTADPNAVEQVVYTVKGRAEDITALLAAQYPSLRVTAVGQTDQLVMKGPAADLKAAITLLGSVDRPVTAAGPEIVQRTFAFANARPDQVKVEDLTKLVRDQYPSLRVTPVGQTGQLVLIGPVDQMDAAIALLTEVDRTLRTDGPQIVQRTFTFSNARASEVKKVLDGTLARQLTAVVPASPTAPAAGPAVTTVQTPVTPTPNAATNGATIIDDPRTNSLIVRGTQAQVDQIAELIPLLDRTVPQINVQVRIQEISESGARNLGIDWSAGIGNFVTKIVAGTVTSLFDMTRSFAGFNLGATLQALESQGLSKSIYEGNVTLKSGQSQIGQAGTTETASAGASASIKSGGRLELNIPSDSGNISKQIDYGVNIDFLNPYVASDGTITLGVKSSVSELNTAVTGNTLPNLLDFRNREAQTTVSFKSGQTLMLGGLLSTVERRNTEGVPFISSIPLVGNLFKTTTNRREQTQLLLVITGNVVQ